MYNKTNKISLMRKTLKLVSIVMIGLFSFSEILPRICNAPPNSTCGKSKPTKDKSRRWQFQTGSK